MLVGIIKSNCKVLRVNLAVKLCFTFTRLERERWWSSDKYARVFPRHTIRIIKYNYLVKTRGVNGRRYARFICKCLLPVSISGKYLTALTTLASKISFFVINVNATRTSTWVIFLIFNFIYFLNTSHFHIKNISCWHICFTKIGMSFFLFFIF